MKSSPQLLMIWLPPDFAADHWKGRAIGPGTPQALIRIVEAIAALHADQQVSVSSDFAKLANWPITVAQIAKRVGHRVTKTKVAAHLEAMAASGLFDVLDLRDLPDVNAIILTPATSDPGIF